MNLSIHHPREQLVRIMQRIYDFGMTTTSGGNLSIRDEEGNVWITPSAVDKGSLHPSDIVRIGVDGSFEGIHKPSSEYPFHLSVYAGRQDLNAIIHAHPPALVSFSIVRKIPDTSIIPQAKHICGEVGYAEYDLPGSEALGIKIGESFRQGFDVVLMENHGTVVGGANLSQAFQKFETLEFCARTQIEASSIGRIKSLDDSRIDLFYQRKRDLPEFVHLSPNTRELWLRGEICSIVKRAYRQRLIISTYGTFSVRLSDRDFLITPYGKDRYYLNREDIVLIMEGKRERGKTPSRSSLLHDKIYREHPEINCIITAQSPFATAYCVASQTFDTRTIPESYILLREIPVIPYGDQLTGGSKISSVISPDIPIVLIENDSILITGKSLMETFDRLEVAEFSARSLTQSAVLGKMVPIEAREIDDLKKKFLSKDP
ncbi:MAG: class II aldolase/adducin family protein [Cyclobacteriaceae bacterium]|nr:class II aldolase/adducin family protein [Cyclobacteriaceae bacterium]